jgi:transcriptional regulator with XRE-family HTH domain
MTPTEPSSLGPALRRIRLVRGWKQSAVAAKLGVDQSSISRLERGDIEPSPEVHERLLALISARLDGHGDAGLRRLIVNAALPVHLICDATHRLLAASRPRESQWRRPVSDLIGVTLWPFVTAEIAAAEASLEARGWREGAHLAGLRVFTEANQSHEVPIPRSTLLWERMTLADGSVARLVSDIEPVCA